MVPQPEQTVRRRIFTLSLAVHPKAWSLYVAPRNEEKKNKKKKPLCDEI
jgi:hypothetical protein